MRDALEHYRRLNEAAKKLAESRENSTENPEDDNSKDSDTAPPPLNTSPSQQSFKENAKQTIKKTDSTASIKSKSSSKVSFFVRSPSSVESEGDNISNDLTETEVEVSERTSKFKISTDTNKPSSRRNSCDSRGNSFDRTMSPKALEERLEIHLETALEHEEPVQNNVNEIEITPTRENSLFQKFKNLSGKLSCQEKNNDNSAKSNEIKSSQSHKGVLKNRSKSVPAKSRNQFSSFSKPKITFDSNTLTSPDEDVFEEQDQNSIENKTQATSEIKTSTSLELQKIKKKPLEQDISASPTLSEKRASPTSAFIFRQKKFSLSLDMLPRKSYKANKEAITPKNTPGSSEDDLLSPGISRACTPDKKSTKLIDSPKTIKKRHESAKELLLKSFSFRKKSPIKSEVSKNSNDSVMDKPKESL